MRFLPKLKIFNTLSLLSLVLFAALLLPVPAAASKKQSSPFQGQTRWEIPKASNPGDVTYCDVTPTYEIYTPSPTSTPSPVYTLTQTLTISPTASITPTCTRTTTPTATPTEGVASLAIRAPASAVAGQALGVTITAVNQWGGNASSYRGSIQFACTDANSTLPGDYTFVPSDGGQHFFANLSLRTAGVQRITVTDLSLPGFTGHADISVTGGPAVSFTISGPAEVWSGQLLSVSVSARDQWNNISAGYRGTVFFTSTDPAASLPADYTFSAADQGGRQFAATLRTAGIRSITAADAGNGSVRGTSNNITVRSAGVDHFEVTAPANANAGSPFTIQVTAKDTWNNTVPNYYGAVTFTASDAAAALPSNYTYQPSDFGVRVFTLTLNSGSTGGTSQWLRVRDTAANTVTGSATVNVISGAALYSQPLLLTSYLPVALEYSYVYVQIANVPAVFPNNAYLEYDVYIPESSVSAYCGLEITNISPVPPGEADLRDFGVSTQTYITDQNGIRCHPSFYLGDHARGRWYHRKFDIGALGGKSYQYVFLSQDTGNRGWNGAPCNRQGTFNAYFDNIRFTNSSGQTLSTIFADQNTLPAGGVSSEINVGNGTFDVTSWRGGVVIPTNNYVFVTKNFMVSANPGMNIPAGNSAVSYLSATMTAADNVTPVTYALVDINSNRPQDTVDAGYVAPETSPLTGFGSGLVTATAKSTLAGASQIRFQAGPFSKAVNVNFVPTTAARLRIDPSFLSAWTNQSVLISVWAEDACGNFVPDGRGVTLGASSGSMQFSRDGEFWFSQLLVAPWSAVSVLVRDSTAGSATITAQALGLVSGAALAVINNAPAQSLQIRPALFTAVAGTAQVVTIQAKDAFNQDAYSAATLALGSASPTMRFSNDQGLTWHGSLSLNLVNGQASAWVLDTLVSTGTTLTAHDTQAVLADGHAWETVIPNVPAILTAGSSLSAVSPPGAVAQITARVTDAYGNRVPNQWVGFAATDQQAPHTAYMDSAGGNTNSQGQVSSNLVTSTLAGNNYVVVTSPGLEAFTVTVSCSNQATQLLLLPNPMSMPADQPRSMYVRSIYVNAGQTYYAPPPPGRNQVLLFSTGHPTRGQTMEFSVNGGANWYRSVTATLDAGGYCEVLIRNHYPQGYTVTGHETMGTLADDTDAVSVATGYFLRMLPATAVNVAAGNTVGVTAQIVDQDGNSVNTAGVPLAFSSTQGACNPLITTTDSNGRGFTVLTTEISSGLFHQVTGSSDNPSMSGVSGVISTVPSISLSVTAPSAVLQTWPFSLQVRARDAYGQTVTNYTGTVHFTSTNLSAGLPSDYTYLPTDAGVKSFAAALNSQGIWTITAADTLQGSIAGTSGNILVGPPPTLTATPTSTPSFTATPTRTRTSTSTATPSRTPSPTITATCSHTPIYSPTTTPTISATSTISATYTITVTYTATPTPTISATFTQTETATPTFTITATATPTSTVTPVVTPEVIYVFPNPFRPAKALGHVLKFDNVPPGTEIEIFTLSAELVREFKDLSGRVCWDGCNRGQAEVASGIYLYLIKRPDGRRVRGKIFLIR